MASVTENRIFSCAMLVAVGVLIGYVEHLFSFAIPVPGVKIGLSNLVVLLALMRYTKSEALLIGILKAGLNGLLFSGGMSILYSLLGIVLSVLAMAVCLRLWYPKVLSAVGVSIAGSALFQVGQVAAACLVLTSLAPVYYLGVLLAVSVFSGGAIGGLCQLLLRRVPDHGKPMQGTSGPYNRENGENE